MKVKEKHYFEEARKLFESEVGHINKVHSDLKSASIQNFEDMKRQFPSLEDFHYVNDWYVIEIGPNLQMVARIHFEQSHISVIRIVSNEVLSGVRESHKKRIEAKKMNSYPQNLSP